MSAPYVRTKSTAVTNVPASITITGKGKGVLLSSTTGCYVSFVGPAISGDALYLPPDYPIKIDSPFIRTISVVRDTDNGVLTVTEESGVAITQVILSSFRGDCLLNTLHVPTAIDGDANLKIRVSATATGDSSIKKINISSSMTGNSSLKSVMPSTVSGDSNLVATIAGAADGDSNLVATIAGAADGDSNLLATVAGSATGDCDLDV